MRTIMLSLLFVAGVFAADTAPQAGQTAPDFMLPSQDGSKVSLHDFRGKWVVLYFYPKDGTTGCTIEAHNFQRDLARYEQRHAVIVGVSVDSANSHQEFCAKQSLTFKLLADTEQRFGKERYEREIADSRRIYNQLRAGGRDRPLADSSWTTRQQADGDIPEHKGAWFLYLLNQMTGDAAFWDALRFYTGSEWGQAATSTDLQRAFDAAGTENRGADRKERDSERRSKPKGSLKNIDSLFDLWVYGVSDSKSK